MKTFLLACCLVSLPVMARADATAPVSVCVISDGQGNWAIVTTNPEGSTIASIHLVISP